MNVVKLEISGYLPGDLTFELTSNGQIRAQGVTHADFSVKDLSDDLISLDRLLPSQINRAMRQWVLDQPSSGLLAILCEEVLLDGIPWEHLPLTLNWPTVSVVRLLARSSPTPKWTPDDQLRLLAAGWSGKPWLNLPAIQNELNALSQLAVGSDVHVRVLFEPTMSELAESYTVIQPLVFHLIPPTFRHEGEMPELVLSGDGDIQWIRVDTFLEQLPENFKPRLVVLNTCNGSYSENGPSATRLITEKLGCISISWLGDVQDQAAYDFALFFYNRLLIEGGTVINALRSYHSLQTLKRNPEIVTRDLRPRFPLEPIPVVWTASLDTLTETWCEPEPTQVTQESLSGTQTPEEVEKTGDPSRPPRWGPRVFSDGTRVQVEDSPLPIVELDFEPQKWLNPALLKNGRPAIVQLALRPDRMLHNVSIAITCDTGNGSSTVRQTINLERGRQPVPADAYHFPILYKLIHDNVSRRHINFTITCRQGESLLAEMTKSALWMELSEWLDKPETWHYIPAFVNPESEGVHEVIGKAIPILKQIVSPTSKFDGYDKGETKFIVKQVESIFNCLRTQFELNYIAPPPLPVFTPGDTTSSGQRVRSPSDVIDRKRGTCHDLAVLFASCLEQIRVYPLIILIRGHTFVGFWNSQQAYSKFWDAAQKNIRRRTQGPGRDWTIADIEELRLLLAQNEITLVEATLVTNRNAEFQHAIQAGNAHLESQRKFDAAIDIQASRREIQPL